MSSPCEIQARPEVRIILPHLCPLIRVGDNSPEARARALDLALRQANDDWIYTGSASDAVLRARAEDVVNGPGGEILTIADDSHGRHV